jgi:O-antigen/teichoic acid export membrane protein
MLNTNTIFILFLALTFVEPVYAYLDPGTGSAILQGLLAALAALAVVVKLYWHRLVKFFRFRKDTTEEMDQNKIED